MDCRIELTDDHIKTLEAQIKRTGLGLSPFFRLHREMPPYMSENIARSWLNGRVNNALRENWDRLIASYEAPPDEAEEGAKQDCLRVAAENKRTGVGRHRILKLMDDPSGHDRPRAWFTKARPAQAGTPGRKAGVRCISEVAQETMRKRTCTSEPDDQVEISGA